MDSSIHSDGRRWVAVPRCTWPAVGRRKPAQTRRAASGGTWHAEKFGVAWIRRSTPMGVGGWQSLAARGPPLVDANRPRQGARRVAGHGTPSHGRRRSSIDRSTNASAVRRGTANDLIISSSHQPRVPPNRRKRTQWSTRRTSAFSVKCSLVGHCTPSNFISDSFNTVDSIGQRRASAQGATKTRLAILR